MGAHERVPRKGQPAAGGNEFPEKLPREEVILDVPESERKGLVKVGEQVSQRLMCRSSYYVKVIRRRLYGEPGCAGTGIVAPNSLPMPSSLAPDSDRCHYDDSVVAHADEPHVAMLDLGPRTGVGPPLDVFYFSRDRSEETARKWMRRGLLVFHNGKENPQNLLGQEATSLLERLLPGDKAPVELVSAD